MYIMYMFFFINRLRTVVEYVFTRCVKTTYERLE